MINTTATKEKFRTKRIEIQVTNEEYLELQSKKTKPRLAEWIRESLLNNTIKQQIEIKADKELLLAIARIGGNINQIAKYCNQNKILSIQVLNELQAIKNQLNEIIKDNNK